MFTLQDFLTSAAVASGSGRANLHPVFNALDAYAANFEGEARHTALKAAGQAISIIKLEGYVRDRLVREIDLRMSRTSRMSR